VDLVLEYIDKAGIRKCLAVTPVYVFRQCVGYGNILGPILSFSYLLIPI